MRYVNIKTIAITFSTCCVFLAAQAASPQTEEHDTGLSLVMERLRKVEKMEARFTNVKTISILREPLHFSGTLKYVAPSYLEKHIINPTRESFIVSGETIKVEITSKNLSETFSLNKHPVLRAFVESFRATLAGDLDTLKHFYEINFKEMEGWSITLKPKLPEMLETIQTIEIYGEKHQVTQFRITDSTGGTSVMNILAETK